jgi:integrase
MDSRVITVVRALGRIEGIKEPKSAAGRRKTVWATDITSDIDEHLAHLPGTWLFTSSRGAMLHYPNWRRRHWLPACERTGLEWTFHEYRHTFAVESLRRGRSVQSVAAMMGHANPRVTWEFYAGLFDDHLEEARATW